ncbi:MAG: phenylalanine--tRNA ligase subunit alpha, partial [Planctomycetes bacterium]|nr:phenylalanine--tRNA ligase subunit alpha [Planctomycetota bacterium]
MSTDDVANVIQHAESSARQAVAEIEQADSLTALEALRIRFLGKRSEINQLSRSLKSVPAESRRDVGQAINAAKKSVETAWNDRKTALSDSASAQTAVEPSIDVTLPGIRTRLGRRHPIMSTMEEVKSILIGLGFRYDDYPEVESEHYNFDALNTPDWHPARDSHDTFYTESGDLLRTHTSAFQTPAMAEFG